MLGLGRHLRGRRGLVARVLREQRLAPAAGELGTHLVGHAAGGDADQPSGGVVGQAFLRPLDGCREQSFLNRVLRGGEVPRAPHQNAEHPRRQFAQQVLGGSLWRGAGHIAGGGALMTSRSSMDRLSGLPPGPGAADALAAMAYARAAFSTSTIQ